MSEVSFFNYSNSIKSPVFLVECNTPETNKIFRSNIDLHHSYKNFKSSPTRNIRWLIYERDSGNNIGSIGLASAVVSVSVRDKYIGWDKDTKMKKLCHIGNNSRFCLIRENITIKNAGSMVLKQLAIEGRKRWKEKYDDDLIMLETFIAPDRNTSYNGHEKRTGAVYRASNWLELGYTKGSSFRKAPLLLWQKEKGARGELSRNDPVAAMEKYGYGGKQYIVVESPKKIMFVKPLVKNWKKLLTS